MNITSATLPCCQKAVPSSQDLSDSVGVYPRCPTFPQARHGDDTAVRWHLSNRADPVARVLADRHYNRQKVGTPQFVPPGRCLVLLSSCAQAFWVTSWPFAQYVKHDWAGAWTCSAFRSEDAGCSIELVRQAAAATRAHFGEPPEFGLVTFIDARKVKPILQRGVPSFGWVWIKAGFHYVGKTKAGLLVFQMLPKDMPVARAALPKAGAT